MAGSLDLVHQPNKCCLSHICQASARLGQLQFHAVHALVFCVFLFQNLSPHVSQSFNSLIMDPPSWTVSTPEPTAASTLEGVIKDTAHSLLSLSAYAGGFRASIAGPPDSGLASVQKRHLFFWLPIKSRRAFKILFLTYQVLRGQAHPMWWSHLRWRRRCFQGMGEPCLPSYFCPNAPSGRHFCHPGQKIWLFLRDFPIQVDSQNLPPCFVGPFEVDRVVNPSTVRLSLPSSLNAHPAFHVSRVKLLSNRLLII